MRTAAASIVLLAAILTGCAATVSRDAPAAGASISSTAPTKRVILEITGAGNIATGEDWDAFLEEWKTSMGAAATPKGVNFSLASSGAAPAVGPAILVRMKVNDFKYVSQAKRFAIGIFSGNAFMDVDVEYLDMPQMKSLGKRKFQTSSSAWQGVFSAMTPKQVEAVSKEIMDELVGK